MEARIERGRAREKIGKKERERVRQTVVQRKKEIQRGHVAFQEISNHTTCTPCRPLNIVYCVTEY